MAIPPLFDRGQGAIGIDVARAGAIAEVAHRVANGGRRFVLLVRIGPVVVRMTARAIRFVRSGRPRRGLRVGRVAIRTRHAGAMIAGITSRRMRESNRRPCDGVVAVVALYGRDEMSGRFARGAGAVVAC